MSIFDSNQPPPMLPPESLTHPQPVRTKDDLRAIRRRVEATPQQTAEELRPEWERLIDTLRNKLPSDVPSGMKWMGW